jgi:HSP20 family protein
MKNVVMYNRPSLSSDFDTLFNSVFGLSPATTNQRHVAVDISELADKYVIEAELPGYSEHDVEIRVEDNLLSIESAVAKDAKPSHSEATTDAYVIRERGGREFRRSFALPKDVDSNNIGATFKHGLLTVEIPKS